MMRVPFLFFLCAGASFCAFSDDAVPSEPEGDRAPASAPYEKIIDRKLFNGDVLSEFKLSNGLRVIFVPRHQAKVLTYQTWFDVGSLNEKLDPKLKKTGLAHLFEHMMFRGSEKYPDGQFEELTARLGCDRQNASTHFYRTNYFENVPAHQLERIAELESDRMKNLKLTAEIIDKEKGAVVGELRRHMDSPSGSAQDDLMRLVFPTSPYQWTVLGTEQEIKGFTLEEAQYFYKTFYAPNNATLIVIGDTSEKPLLEIIVRYYGGMSLQNIPRVEVPPEPPQKKERRMERSHAQATSEILLVAYPAPPIGSPDQSVGALVETHLGAGMEGRLRKSLVDRGVAVHASASSASKPDIFEFYVQMAEGHHAEEALSVVDREIQTLKSSKLPANALERSLNQNLLSLYSEISDNAQFGNFLGESLMLSGNYMRGFEIIEGVKKVSLLDIQRFAKEYLIKERRSVVILRPEKKGKA